LTFSIILFTAFIVGLAIRAGGGKLSDLIVGQDRRTSTSKTQYMLWTVGVAFALTYVAMRTFVGSTSFTCSTGSANCVPDGSVWEQYVILLGVPATAALVAKASTTYKSVNGIIQQTDANQAKVADIATDDQGNASITDIQYLVFNVIAFMYFAANFLSNGTFIEIPSMILGLTSASAATYTLNKTLQNDRPVIKSVLPNVIAPGTKVTISGINVFPDPEVKFVTVTVGGQIASADLEGNSGSVADNVSFVAPLGMTPNTGAMTVSTSSGTQSDGYVITVVGHDLLGWLNAAPSPGNNGALRVSGISPGDYQIRVNGVIQDVTYDDANETLPVQVPATVATGGSIDVAILFNGSVLAMGSLLVA
jgi:hypothetical protein